MYDPQHTLLPEHCKPILMIDPFGQKFWCWILWWPAPIPLSTFPSQTLEAQRDAGSDRDFQSRMIHIGWQVLQQNFGLGSQAWLAACLLGEEGFCDDNIVQIQAEG